MKKNLLSNSLAVAELGLLSASEVKLATMKKIIERDPLAYYQEKILAWDNHFSEMVDLACCEIADYINSSNRIEIVVWAGHEAALLDRVTSKIGNEKKQVVIPNHRDVNRQRLLLNFNRFENIAITEIDVVWDMMFAKTVLLVPYFELADRTCWSYCYPAMILNDRLYGKPRKVIGVCLLNDVRIDADEDYSIGALSLLTKINPEIFKKVIFVEPKIDLYELDNYTHSN